MRHDAQYKTISNFVSQNYLANVRVMRVTFPLVKIVLQLHMIINSFWDLNNQIKSRKFIVVRLNNYSPSLYAIKRTKNKARTTTCDN